MLNRRYFKAPPAAHHALALQKVLSPDAHALLSYQAALGGYTDEAQELLESLKKEVPARVRFRVINALALIGSDAVVSSLAERYDREDEDCRFNIIKAMDYIGSDAAIAVIRAKGATERHTATRLMAEQILASRQ